MQGQDGFNQDGTAGKNQAQGDGKGKNGGQPSAGGGGAGGWGGFRPPAGAPTPSKKIDTLVKGQKGKGPELVTPFRGAPDRTDSKAPYYSVNPSALRQAEDALAKEEVPAAYRKPVKEYFEGLRSQ